MTDGYFLPYMLSTKFAKKCHVSKYVMNCWMSSLYFPFLLIMEYKEMHIKERKWEKEKKLERDLKISNNYNNASVIKVIFFQPQSL